MCVCVSVFSFWIVKLIWFMNFNIVGVQKERMEPEDMYVLAENGSILSSPSPKPYPNKPPKCSDCAPLFLKVSIFLFLK